MGEMIDKSNEIRCSNWSKHVLSDEQIQYASLDVIKPLQVYAEIKDRPDLSVWFDPTSVVDGAMVDIVPPHQRNKRRKPLSGYHVGDLATRGGVGRIVVKNTVSYRKAGVFPSVAKTTEGETVVVRVEEVLAPALAVPGHKVCGKKAYLEDFGEGPFELVLPLSMLRPHIPSQEIRVYEPPHTSTQSRLITPPTTQQSGVYKRQVLVDLESSDDDPEDSIAIGLDRLEDTLGNSDEELTDLERDARIERLTEQLDTINESIFLAESAETEGCLDGLVSQFLDSMPTALKYIFSAVLGDCYHAMDRPKVPIRHEYKKAYFVALMHAFFIWNEKKLNNVKAKLKENGQMTDDDIDDLMYFCPEFFQKRVERVVPPPKQLYHHVRAVYVTFGSKIDSATTKPLFNAAAWAKANNVLKEIQRGYYSDPPGFNFYSFALDKDGNKKIDKFGIPLLRCSRGTNLVENVHKSYSSTFRAACGFELGDCMLAERRHRRNIRMAERRIASYPHLGHYNTWLVDELQLLVERIHGKVMYPSWISSSDFRDTHESFTTVALHSDELHEALNCRLATLDKEKMNLTSDQSFLCRQMGVGLPFLPINGEEEYRLFSRLLLNHEGNFDADGVAVKWMGHVDGQTIFPKLPAQLRSYFKIWERNRRVQSAVKKMKKELAQLQVAHKNSSIQQVDDGLDFETLPHNDGSTDGDDANVTVSPNTTVSPYQFAFPPPVYQFDQPPPAMTAYRTIPVLPIYTLDLQLPASIKKGRHKGTRDIAPREKRKCRLCVENHGPAPVACPGRNDRTRCIHFMMLAGGCIKRRRITGVGSDVE